MKEEKFIEKYEEAMETLRKSYVFKTVKGIEVGAEIGMAAARLVAGQISNDWGSVAEGVVAGIEATETGCEISQKLVGKMVDAMG